MNTKIISIILLGGSGERLWPLSRNSYPKQFLKLNTEFSLLQETALRADLISQKMTQRVDQKSQIALDQSQLTSLESKPWIICNEEHKFLATGQLKEVNIKNQKIISIKRIWDLLVMKKLFCIIIFIIISQ